MTERESVEQWLRRHVDDSVDVPMLARWIEQNFVYPGAAHPYQDDSGRCGYALPLPCGRPKDHVTHRKPWCLACHHEHWQDSQHVDEPS